MKELIILLCLLFSFSILAKDKLVATPINSPVKETYLKVKLEGFDSVSKVLFKPKNGGTESEGEVVKEGSNFIGKFRTSFLKSGKYEYRVRVRTSSGQSTQNEAASVDWIQFEIDPSLGVADPGEEGKKTLAGIDANNNQVRDDAERWINENYLMSTFPSTNQGLKQISKYQQLSILNASSKSESIKYNHMKLDSISCLRWIRLDGSKIEERSRLLFYNTKDRIKAKMIGTLNFAGQGTSVKKLNTPYGKYNELCEFSAAKEQNN